MEVQVLVSKHVYDDIRDATDPGDSRAPALHSRPHGDSGADGFCCRLRGLGLDLFGDPHRDRIVSTADPGGTPPPDRGPVSLPGAACQDQDQADCRKLAHSRRGRHSAAVRWQWRGQLGGTDRALGHRGAPGGHGIALAGDCGLAPPWWPQACSPGGDRASNGICRAHAAGRACAPWRFRARRSTGRCGAGGCLPGLGVWFALFQTRWDAQFADAGGGMQSLAGGAILLIAGLFAGEFRGLHLGAISLRSWLALAYLMVFGSGIGFSAYIYILHQSTATRVATYAFVNPVVALFLGWLLLGETITLRTVIATAVILTAVILVITAPHRTPAPVRDPVPAPGEV